MSTPSGPVGPPYSEDGPGDGFAVDVSAFLPEGVALGEPEPTESRAPSFDPGALDGLEADLDAVDQALLAIDEGRYQGGPWERIGAGER